MTYSTDLRKRILDFIQTGGKKSETSRRFSVDRSTIYRGLEAQDLLSTQKPEPKQMSGSDIKSGAIPNVPPIVKHVLRNTPHAKRSFTSMNMGFVPKVIGILGPLRKANLLWG